MANHHPLARSIQAVGIAAAMLLIAGNASAAGFALIEQSVSSMGTAYAGAGSAAEDASYVFFNPASMSALEGSQMSAGVHIVLPSTEFKGACTYNANAAAPGVIPSPGDPCAPGNDGGDGGVTGVVPHFTYVHSINNKWDFGIGVNAPFGLSTEYKKGWAGRYSAVESAITAINLNPTLSVKLSDQASIGFGVNAMYTHLALENAVDDAAFGPFPGDTTAKFDLEDWGYGFNFGVLLEPSDRTRLEGLAYRSKIDVELDGDFKTTTALTPIKKEDAKTDVSLPDSLLLSAWHQLTPKTAIMGDVLWTHWSRIPDVVIKRKTSGATSTFDIGWENTLRVAIGASYKYSDKLTLRTGVAHDETPTPNKDQRLAALPDNDRIWLDFGIGYKHSNTLSFDLGYAHLFIDDPKINSTDAAPPAIHTLTGKYDASTDIISAQMNYKF